MSNKKTVIVIAGPTAVGKTAVAIEVARHFGTEIISADSRQCYRELKIGVARPSHTELAAVPHHFIASHSIHQKITAADFERYALEKVATIFKQHHTVVMVGGTGLYIKAFCEGLDAIPQVPHEIHDAVVKGFEKEGLPWLQQRVKEEDALFYDAGDIQNPHRLMRALEVKRATGSSITSYRTRTPVTRPFRIVKLALELPRPELYDRINRRVDLMMEEGLLEEARSLAPYQHLNALQTVGYGEWFDHFNGLLSYEDAIDAIKKHSRHYAKRQLTWFRKDQAFQWCAPQAGLDLAKRLVLED